MAIQLPPTPRRKNDSGRKIRCRIVKHEKALLDCLAFGEFGPSAAFGACYRVNWGHKLETFPGG